MLEEEAPPAPRKQVDEVQPVEEQVWDLGGQEWLWTSWATYYRGSHAVIATAGVLAFANKQDLKDAMTPAEITDALPLHSIKTHDWHIQACCALTGVYMMV
ncbi:hypothetical protein HAX54_002407 [Datura stramonium]|uniref:Uncharacterized protein n=1 Tax=Datura stramonium TaxID=4076 RepID=A0ABS8T3V3_DATST|nr:hypothetical protein [Datura stramonium]